MKAGTKRKRPTEVLGILTLSVGMIVLCLLTALATAGAKHSLGEDAGGALQHQEALSYIQTLSREQGRLGERGVVELSGTSALRFKTPQGDRYLYYHEGGLWELFTTEATPRAESGKAVVLCPEIQFLQTDGLIRVTVGSGEQGVWL